MKEQRYSQCKKDGNAKLFEIHQKRTSPTTGLNKNKTRNVNDNTLY